MPSTFLLGVTQPQELTMETTGSPDKQIVGANGIPKGCMSFSQGSPLHLLRQAWNQVDCSWTSLNNLDGFLTNVAMMTLKSTESEFDIMRTKLNTLKHVCLMMVTKPRVTRCRQCTQCNHPKGVITRYFHKMAQY